MGNQLLVEQIPGYPADENAKYGVKEYTVDAVATVVSELELPAPVWMVIAPTTLETALEVFTGYVLLDAWVANQDRHHQNWGAIRDGEHFRLAPTYDHGAALARNLTDEERADRLNTRDRGRTIAHFAARARSAFYDSPKAKKTLSALEVFAIFAKINPSGGCLWADQLSKIPPETVRGILDLVPSQRMSTVCREFTSQLLTINQQRILDLFASL